MKTHFKKHQTPWLIFFIGLAIFSLGLSPELVAFQTRFAFFAQEMLQHGIKLFPYTYQGPYPDYPLLPTLLIYLFSWPISQVTSFTAILPTAITSSLILVFIYLLGKTQSERLGIYAVLFALLTQTFIDASRSITLDQYTSLITLIVFYIAYLSTLDKNNKRLWWLPILLTLGFLFRGPIGLVIPASVLGGFYLWSREFKQFILVALLSIVLLALLMLLLLSAAYYTGGISFVHQVLLMEMIGRLNPATGHQPLYYFLQSFASYALAYPVAIVLILAQLKPLLYTFKSDKNKALKFLALLATWVVILLIGMSIPGDKKIRYILPIVPACSIIAASVFEPTKNKMIRWLKKTIIMLCLLLPFIAIVISIVAITMNNRLHLFLSFSSFFLSSVVLAIFTAWLFFAVKENESRQLSVVMIAAFTLVLINIKVLGPINYALERTQPFISQVQELEQQKNLPIVFYNIGPDEEDIKFMLNWPTSFKPTFILDKKQLLQYPKKAYFIALLPDYQKLSHETQIKKLLSGKIGHRETIVFTIQPVPSR